MDYEEPGLGPATHGALQNEITSSGSGTETQISSSNDRPFQKMSLLGEATDLYCEVLLIRAHSLFYSSIRAEPIPGSRESDPDPGDELFDAGQKSLDEAGVYCMGGKQFISQRVNAKYWYVSGFKFDSKLDRKNAEDCFRRAIDLDESYKHLSRPKWYLDRQVGEDELSDMWNESEASSPRRNKTYIMGEIGSPRGSIRPGSSASRSYPSPRSIKASPANPRTPSTVTHSWPTSTSTGSSAIPPTPSTVTRKHPWLADQLMQELKDAPLRERKNRSQNTNKDSKTTEKSDYTLTIEKAEELKASALKLKERYSNTAEHTKYDAKYKRAMDLLQQAKFLSDAARYAEEESKQKINQLAEKRVSTTEEDMRDEQVLALGIQADFPEEQARRTARQMALDRLKGFITSLQRECEGGLSNEATLMTDTPSITQEETQGISAARRRRTSIQEADMAVPEEAAFTSANRSALTISPALADTPQIRRLSLSPTSSLPTGPSSPLRKSSVPGDVEEVSD